MKIGQELECGGTKGFIDEINGDNVFINWVHIKKRYQYSLEHLKEAVELEIVTLL